MRVIRYVTKPDRADENQALIEAVMAELAETRPAGLTYSAHRLEDGVSFVHLVEISTLDNPLSESPAFAAFAAGIADRCQEPPVNLGADLVGSYSG